MMLILGLGVGAYFGGEKVHRKMLASKDKKDRLQLERMNIEIQNEHELEKMKPTEAELREAEQDVERFLDPDWIE